MLKNEVKLSTYLIISNIAPAKRQIFRTHSHHAQRFICYVDEAVLSIVIEHAIIDDTWQIDFVCIDTRCIRIGIEHTVARPEIKIWEIKTDLKCTKDPIFYYLLIHGFLFKAEIKKHEPDRSNSQ